MNTKSGLWKCFSCGKAGNWFTLSRAFGCPIEDRYEDYAPIDDRIYDKVRAKLRRPVTEGHHKALLAYCRERGFTDETLNAWKVSTKGDKTLRWPIFSIVNGAWKIVNARCRVVIDRDKAHTKDWFEVSGGPTGLLIGNHLLDLEFDYKAENREPEVMIVEGQWDAMTAYQLGFRNVFSLPNGASHVDLGSMLRYVPEDWGILLAVDMDKSGDRAVQEVLTQVDPERVRRCWLPKKDLNEWFMKVPTLTKENVLSTAKSMIDRPTELPEAPHEPRGFSFLDIPKETQPSEPVAVAPWRRLVEMLGGGFYPSQTTGILAPSGVGKTTFVNEIAVYNAIIGYKVGLISVEGSREKLGRSILQTAMNGYPADMIENTPEVLQRNLNLSLLEGKDTKWQQCLTEFEFMYTKGIKFFILDNLDFIMSRKNLSTANSEKIEAYGALIDFAMRRKVHVVVVWQPKKIDRDAIVDSGMQKGMSQAYQDADNYLSLNRFKDLRRVELEKCRWSGDLVDERFLWLKYDPKFCCLDEQLGTGGLSPVGSAEKPKALKKEEDDDIWK